MSKKFSFSSETDVDKLEIVSKTKRLARKYGKVIHIETKRRDPFIPPSLENKLREELPKQRVITPNKVAITNDIMVSTAKKLLNDLEKEGIVKLTRTSSRLKIYKGSESK
ncbi:MAG: hypothetical protein ACTSWY_15595 [Promethearchaeota archaeon]